VDGEEVVLSTAEINEHLAGITYKPGWKFSAYEDRYEGQHIFILAALPNAYRADETMDIGVRTAVPPLLTTEQLDEWLIWRLIRIESHEAREFLQRDGKPIFDPHRVG
jgi:hypothetical protein